jgi:two-component system, OmpR family, sensor histidine kinase KdpD
VPKSLLSRRFGYVGSVLLVGAVLGLLELVPNPTDTVRALVLLVSVFVSAWIWESGPGVLAAVLATIGFNFLFLPPVYTFTIQDPANVVALGVFLAAALIIGRLSALARLRLRQLEAERKELIRLAQLSQAFFADTNRESFLGIAADRLHRALGCKHISILLGTDEGGLEVAAASGTEPIRTDLAELAFRQGNSASFPSAFGGTDVYLPIPLGVQRVGSLAALGVQVSERMVEGCALLVGLALEREKFVKVARTAEEARAREEMQTTLLATLAHDLKTPVAAVRGAVDNWEAEDGPTEKSRLVGESLARLTRLIDELLEVVRLESSVGRPQRERTSAMALVEAAVARFGDALAGHPFFVDTPPEDLYIEADPAQVTEALGLGLENAARYSPVDRPIRLGVIPDDALVRFRIEDSGPGIPAEERRHVLEKFVRLPTTSSIPGSGLGLYIARRLVEENGGQIEIDASPAGGTRLDIALRRVS